MKEQIILRNKELDHYLNTTKKLLNDTEKLSVEIKRLIKNKKVIDEELKKLHNWFRKT